MTVNFRLNQDDIRAAILMYLKYKGYTCRPDDISLVYDHDERSCRSSFYAEATTREGED